MIRCIDLVKNFELNGTDQQVLRGVDLEIHSGEMTAIVGASGSGKSTLMNIIGGLIEPTAGGVIVNELDLTALSSAQRVAYRQREVGFVWQQSSRNLSPYLTVSENVAYPILLAGTHGSILRERTLELLDLVGISHRADHRLPMLSGGEQQRAAIAVALANDPGILLADEPTGELDTATADAVYDAFQTLNRQKGLTIIIVSHDPMIAQHVGRVITIQDGQIVDDQSAKMPSRVESFSPDLTIINEASAVLGISSERLTTFVAENALEIELEDGDQSVRLQPIAVSEADHPTSPSRLILPNRDVLAEIGRGWERDLAEAPAVVVDHISRIYNPGPQQVVAIDQLVLELEVGKFVALKGRSGSGKTTLLNCLGGLDRPNQGSIAAFGKEISGLSKAALAAWRRSTVGFIFQAYGLLPMLSAYENVELMLRICNRANRHGRQLAKDLLALVGLAEHMNKRPYELSGGQLQRVAIARALVNQPRLLLADEATGELDSETGQDILAVFRTIAHESGITILLATHDGQVDGYADQVLNMKDGRIEEVGVPI